MLAKDVKVFDRASFLYQILNTDEDLINILTDAPVIGEIDDKDVVVGLIQKPYKKNGKIFSDVFIYPKYLEFAKCFVKSQEIMFDISSENSNTIYIKNIFLHITKELDKSENK